MSFSTDKASALEKLQAFDCDMAASAGRMLNSYNDVFKTLIFLTRTFACNTSLMDDYIACWADSELTSRGIYYNKTGTAPTDAKYIAKCTYTTLTVTIPAGGIINELVIIGSTITNLIIDRGAEGIYIGVLNITGGTIITKLSTINTAIVKTMRVNGCSNIVSTVKTATSDSLIETIITTGGGYFGGYKCLDLSGTCADNVANLNFSKITSTSFVASWTNPSSHVRTIVYYRENNTGEWLNADDNNGDGITANYCTDGTVGYSFKGCKTETYYDVRIVNVCDNGQNSSGVTGTVFVTQPATTIVTDGSNVANENLTPLIDGVTNTFALSYTPNLSMPFKLFLNGSKKISPADYSVSGLDVIMVSIPTVGTTIEVEYYKM